MVVILLVHPFVFRSDNLQWGKFILDNTAATIQCHYHYHHLCSSNFQSLFPTRSYDFLFLWLTDEAINVNLAPNKKRMCPERNAEQNYIFFYLSELFSFLCVCVCMCVWGNAIFVSVYIRVYFTNIWRLPDDIFNSRMLNHINFIPTDIHPTAEKDNNFGCNSDFHCYIMKILLLNTQNICIAYWSFLSHNIGSWKYKIKLAPRQKYCRRFLTKCHIPSFTGCF